VAAEWLRRLDPERDRTTDQIAQAAAKCRLALYPPHPPQAYKPRAEWFNTVHGWVFMGVVVCLAAYWLSIVAHVAAAR
jgi:hypothetical protein